MRLRGLFLAAGLLWSPSVFASYITGNELYKNCTANIRDDIAGAGICVGYVEGIADAHEFDATNCVPPGVSVGQIKDVIVKYLAETPQLRHQSAALLGWMA